MLDDFEGNQVLAARGVERGGFEAFAFGGRFFLEQRTFGFELGLIQIGVGLELRRGESSIRVELCDLFIGVGLHCELLRNELLLDDADLGFGFGSDTVGLALFIFG